MRLEIADGLGEELHNRTVDAEDHAQDTSGNAGKHGADANERTLKDFQDELHGSMGADFHRIPRLSSWRFWQAPMIPEGSCAKEGLSLYFIVASQEVHHADVAQLVEQRTRNA